MTRVRISAAILFLLVITSILSGVWADRNCRKLIGEAQAVCAELENGDRRKAGEMTAELCRDWKSFRSKAALLVKNDKLMDTDRIAAHFEPAAGSCGEDLLPHLTEFMYMVYILRRNELPYFSSVL